ncbi:uncharacterized protein F5891DRAFT_1244043 [Suillus fuscotomentosus]|uniref:Uncharacterized protein n=1 Tax=Suillus fuscotomentosus TaxID=1912939 RepID=A0AAD4EJC4_9AGAM|nr:uncharacterized protein F5891DRAFT_1244043 [Suillus fuscotomentosus]KAG1906063.1 hypothetical protein F5891DRAFT_1244043 [Suillus fuscotomentosus]
MSSKIMHVTITSASNFTLEFSDNLKSCDQRKWLKLICHCLRRTEIYMQVPFNPSFTATTTTSRLSIFIPPICGGPSLAFSLWYLLGRSWWFLPGHLWWFLPGLSSWFLPGHSWWPFLSSWFLPGRSWWSVLPSWFLPLAVHGGPFLSFPREEPPRMAREEPPRTARQEPPRTAKEVPQGKGQRGTTTNGRNEDAESRGGGSSGERRIERNLHVNFRPAQTMTNQFQPLALVT